MRDLMASLARRFGRRLRRDERGAIAIVVAVLLGCGLIGGMAAMVVDVAQLYQERAELQNGADAAAIGVAKSCALGLCDQSVAQQYANGNASSLTGGTEGIGLVCGSAAPLAPCPSSTGSTFDCPPPPPAGTNYVDVHTHTMLASGSTLLPPVFAQSIIGNGGDQGSTVDACAQAEWGAPSSATVVAITISACEWDDATQQGNLFAPAPPYQQTGPPAQTFDRVLQLSPGNGTGCLTEPAGADGRLTFGFAADQAGNCTLLVNGPTYAGQVAASPSEPCENVLDNAQDSQLPILVPVYVSVTNAAGSLTYTLKGFAHFVVTGYQMPGGFFDTDWLNPANNCLTTQTCLNGYFVRGVTPATGPLTGTNLGLSVIDLTG